MSSGISTEANGDPAALAGTNPHGRTAPELELVSVRCVLCGSQRATAHAAGYDYEYNTARNSFLFVSCSDCAHLYLQPRPATSDLGTIYPSNYYTLAARTGLVARMQRVWEKRKVERYAKLIGAGTRRVLDIGCGDGRLLEVLRSFGPRNWQFVGVDFDQSAVEKCRALGFEAHTTRVEDFRGEEGTFDGVIMLQLIEHVEDPVEICRRVHSLLRPGGAFVIETPNLGGLDYRLFKRRWWGHYHFPRHWNLFTTRTLHRMLRDSGFVIEATEYLISTSSWTISLHNYLFDKRLPGAVVRFFHYRNPLLLGFFVLLDWSRSTLGLQTSNMRVIARRPA